MHEDLRGAGIGSALMQAAEQEAVGRGCDQIVLWTHSIQAPKLYEKLGFQSVAPIPEYPIGHESIIYIKHLT